MPSFFSSSKLKKVTSGSSSTASAGSHSRKEPSNTSDSSNPSLISHSEHMSQPPSPSSASPMVKPTSLTTRSPTSAEPVANQSDLSNEEMGASNLSPAATTAGTSDQGYTEKVAPITHTTAPSYILQEPHSSTGIHQQTTGEGGGQGVDGVGRSERDINESTVSMTEQRKTGGPIIGTAAGQTSPSQQDVLHSKTGHPITQLPPSASRGLSAVLTSGERGIGEPGQVTLDRINATPKELGGVQAVVGEAKGTGPELVTGTTKEKSGEAGGTGSSSSSSWLDKLHIPLKSGSGNNASDSPSQEKIAASAPPAGPSSSSTGTRNDGSEALHAINTVAPAEITGANISGVDGASQTKYPLSAAALAALAAGSADNRSIVSGADDLGKLKKEEAHQPVEVNGPAVLSAEKGGSNSRAAANMDNASVTTSVKDKILVDFQPDPNTSNEKFHDMFSSIPEADCLIEDFRCALQRDILVQGRIFISEHHLAFKANILGWETNCVIPFSEIVTIEKRMTALVIPNAIEVSTIHAHHTFASLLSRDSAYKLMVAVWRHAHPEEAENQETGKERESARGAAAASRRTTSKGDKGKDNENDFEEVEDGEEQKDNREDALSYTDDEGRKKKYWFKKNPIMEVLPSSMRNARSKKTGGGGGGGGGGAEDQGLTPAEKVKEKAKAKMNNKDASPKNSNQHKETKYDGEEFKELVLDVEFPTSPEKVYSLMFKDVDFLKRFWEEDQGLKEVVIGEWKSPEDKEDSSSSSSSPPSTEEGETRESSYLKPLNAPMGPKETHCILDDVNEHYDTEEYVSTVTTTKSPDVPSGKDFSVQTRSVFTWSESGGVRVRVTTQVAWTKTNRMLKGIIERSCLDGQKKYHVAIDKVIREHIEEHKDEFIIQGASSGSTGSKDGGAKSSSDDERRGSGEGGVLGSVLDTLRSFVPEGGATLSLFLIGVLFITNFWTLVALRHQANESRSHRLGNPDQVAKAVDQVLKEFNQVHQARLVKEDAVHKGSSTEWEKVLNYLNELQQGADQVSHRVEGLRRRVNEQVQQQQPHQHIYSGSI